MFLVLNKWNLKYAKKSGRIASVLNWKILATKYYLSNVYIDRTLTMRK